MGSRGTPEGRREKEQRDFFGESSLNAKRNQSTNPLVLGNTQRGRPARHDRKKRNAPGSSDRDRLGRTCDDKLSGGRTCCSDA